jgi:hypothetical protein
LFNRLVDRLKASAREEIQETARAALLYAIAAVAALMALVFLTIAGFWWLSQEMQPIYAALVVAGAYAVLAIGVLAWASSGGTSTGQEAGSEPASEATQAMDAATMEEAPDMPGKLGIDVDTVADTLADSGFRAEALAVTAFSDIIRQLTPLQFVSLVFVGSFLIGRRLRS